VVPAGIMSFCVVAACTGPAGALVWLCIPVVAQPAPSMARKVRIEIAWCLKFTFFAF
jgi:hypothetical protein